MNTETDAKQEEQDERDRMNEEDDEEEVRKRDTEDEDDGPAMTTEVTALQSVFCIHKAKERQPQSSLR